MQTNLHRCLTLALLLVTFTCGGAAHASTQDETAIRGVLNAQVAAWNRGDVVTFMQGYNNSPDTTFVGKTVAHGYSSILDRYRKNYTDKDKMGQLTFSDLEVHPLDAHFASRHRPLPPRTQCERRRRGAGHILAGLQKDICTAGRSSSTTPASHQPFWLHLGNLND